MGKKNVLLCVSGGIAAYKAIDLCSRLHKAGYLVRTILTKGALEFVSAINFSAISHNSVHTELFMDSDPIPHINLADWADILVVAPATANIIAKAAHGIADDLCSATLLACTQKILFVPAMNVNMYAHPATRENISKLQERGALVLEPEHGMLACAYEGLGKYPSNSIVMQAIETYLSYNTDLKGKKVLVTAGATREALDPMRYISNRSSGKMGFALATAAALRGALVSLVYGPTHLEIPHILHSKVLCESAEDMYKACLEAQNTQDWIIKCAAVSDYKPLAYSTNKIKKTPKLSLEMVQGVDILHELGKTKLPGQILVGFAAETEDLIKNAEKKLKAKNLDMIVANHLSVAGAEDTSVSMLFKNHKPINIEGSKLKVAHQILDEIKANER